MLMAQLCSGTTSRLLNSTMPREPDKKSVLVSKSNSGIPLRTKLVQGVPLRLTCWKIATWSKEHEWGYLQKMFRSLAVGNNFTMNWVSNLRLLDTEATALVWLAWLLGTLAVNEVKSVIDQTENQNRTQPADGWKPDSWELAQIVHTRL